MIRVDRDGRLVLLVLRERRHRTTGIHEMRHTGGARERGDRDEQRDGQRKHEELAHGPPPIA